MICCYFPTTTVVIDDDRQFTRAVKYFLSDMECISYNSPIEAIQTIQKQNPSQRIKSRMHTTSTTSEYANSLHEDYSILVNIRSLHEDIYHSDRFKDVSVIIVDYYMDGLNGIELCEALLNHPAKKNPFNRWYRQRKTSHRCFQ